MIFKSVAFAVVLSIFLIVVGQALAAPAAPVVDQVASRLAQRPATVECFVPEGDPLEEPFGYVHAGDTVVHIQQSLCDAAAGIGQNLSPATLGQMALGALVLAHESYHVRVLRSPLQFITPAQQIRHESMTECWAIRHFRYTVGFLGGSPGLADLLMPYALAYHAALPLQYHATACNVPTIWPK